MFGRMEKDISGKASEWKSRVGNEIGNWKGRAISEVGRVMGMYDRDAGGAVGCGLQQPREATATVFRPNRKRKVYTK
jgi:hypothetical protein